MRFIPYNKVIVLKIIIILQLTTLLIYLNANIVDVGEMGVALHLLIEFVGLTSLLFAMFWVKKSSTSISTFFSSFY
ncbi:hypothetical protein VCSRO8_0271 [Vibrio cholerae]|nr:hypothetical protein VCSRO8_0271 [Vibrio cholerae]